jgi:hypothetical protein
MVTSGAYGDAPAEEVIYDKHQDFVTTPMAFNVLFFYIEQRLHNKTTITLFLQAGADMIMTNPSLFWKILTPIGS